MSKEAPTSTDTQQTRFSSITDYFRTYRRYLILGGIVVVLSNGLALVIPYITKLIFDLLEQGATASDLVPYIVAGFGLAVLSGVFRFSMRRTIIWMSRKFEYDFRGRIFRHLLNLSQSFYHTNRTGDIMARLTNDLEAVRQMVGPGIMYISNTLVVLVVAFAVMIYLSPMLTLWASIPLVLLPIGVNLIGNVLHRQSMKVQDKFSELTVAAQENLSGIRVVKAYGQEDAEVENFRGHSEEYYSLNMTLAKLQGTFIPAMRMIAAVSYFVVLYFGGLKVIEGELSVGDVVAFFGYLSMIMWPLIAIGWVTSLYQRGTASLDRINRILYSAPQIVDTSDNPHDARIKGEVEFRDLTFGYNGRPVLHDISLTIKAGQTVGLVGPTGSGKTTLAALIGRLFQVPSKQLFIDGVDVNDWKVDTLRRQIGYAPQEPFLFSDTVKENIRFGRPEATDEEIVEASRTAALTKDIASFKNGYATMVGERGITLSGGQKQRTAIARAVLTDPAILILDDATSAVDTETEHQINQQIKKVLHNRTAIIISHRVASVKDADVILYLEEGRIIESGSHEKLLKSDGAYAELYRSQLIEQELEAL